MWGDDVLVAIDRGLAVAAFTPARQLIGQWAFSLDEKPGVQLPPTPYVLRGESPCAVLRPGERTAVGEVLADGGWWATVEGKGRATIALATDQSPATWRHRVAGGRGEASIDAQGSRLILEAVPGTRSIFRLSMPPSAAMPAATLEPGDINAVRVCRASIPSLPPTGALEVDAGHDDWFGARLASRRARRHAALPLVRAIVVAVVADGEARERQNDSSTARGERRTARPSRRRSTASRFPPARCRQARGPTASLALPETSMRSGINELSLNADTMSPSADRPGDARELAFVMQASRVRVGQ